MLEFKEVRFKNFISYGSAETAFDLSDSGVVCVTGSSGGGKSTIIEAIVFALFGKGYRPFTKSQIINWINKRDCLVKLSLDVDGKMVEVIRGIKPNIFEFSVNGVAHPPMPEVKEYQKILETLLNINYSTFTQTILIGTTSYVPFMVLGAADRRKLVDNILRLNVFSDMRNRAKSDLSDTNTEYRSTQTAISREESYIDHETATIERMVNINQDDEQESKKIIENLTNDVKTVELSITKIDADIQALNEQIEPLSQELDNLRQIIVKATSRLQYESDDLKKTSDFYTKHDQCPTCSQTIQSNHKATILAEMQEKSRKIDEFKAKIELRKQEYNDKKTSLETLQKLLAPLVSSKNTMQGERASLLSSIHREKSKAKTSSSTDLIESSKKSLQKRVQELQTLKQKLTELQTKIDIINGSIKILGDDGVRAMVIDKYLPFFETRINQILHETNMDIMVKFDTDFNETIYTQRRDETTYSALSQGERKRIDLAILFVLREIASSTNVSTSNIIFVDEIFDHGLDSENLQYFFEMLDGKNLFLISHNQNVIDHAHITYHVKKDGHGFSSLEKLS